MRMLTGYCNEKRGIPTHDEEDHREHAETQELNGFSAPAVDQRERDPKPRDEATECDHDIPRADVPNVFVDAK